jgi:hypothetical protein
LRGNSQSVDKALEAADMAANLGVDTIADVATSGFFPTLIRKVKDQYEKVIVGVTENTRVEIARQLTNFDNPAAQREFLNRLARLKAKGELRAKDVTANARAMSGAGTQAAGPGLLSPED